MAVSRKTKTKESRGTSFCALKTQGAGRNDSYLTAQLECKCETESGSDTRAEELQLFEKWTNLVGFRLLLLLISYFVSMSPQWKR